jgi:hypothetical protein
MVQPSIWLSSHSQGSKEAIELELIREPNILNTFPRLRSKRIEPFAVRMAFKQKVLDRLVPCT